MGYVKPEDRVLTIPEEYAKRSVVPRLEFHSKWDGEHRVWTGEQNAQGYGIITLHINKRRRRTGAHRATWLAINGDIPIGLDIDHLCRNKLCLIVDHMELVTAAVNTFRKHGRDRQTTPDEVFCRSHGRSDGRPEFQRHNGVWVWRCFPCRRAASKLYRQRKKQREENQ